MDCSYRSLIRAKLDSEIFSRHQLRLELKHNLFPEVELFRNIRSLTLDQWESFNPATGEMEITEDNDNPHQDAEDIDPTPHIKKKRDTCMPLLPLYYW